MERERDYYRQRAQTMHEHQDGQVWYWQGDGGDHLESMCNSLPVVIRADQLRVLLAAERAAPAAPTEQQAYDIGAKGAPATDAERLLFEAWMSGHCWALCATWDGKCYRSDAEQGGNIDPRAMNTRQLWAAWRDRAALAASPAQPAPEPFQQRVQPWMMECFGPVIAADRVERNHRFLEESLELVQSLGCTQSEAHQLVDYVFGRPVGEPAQEVGGVMVTLAALCLANGLDMHDAGEVELARISVPETVAKIRAKQAAKPKHSPLPGHAQPAPAQDGRDYPAGAIVNGRIHIDRLESLHYNFECEAGPLRLCSDWDGLKRCFEHLADRAARAPAPAPAATADALDAARWRAFIGSARIRFFGWAGADIEGNKQERNTYGEANGNYVHFGAEFWTVHEAKTERPEVAARLLTTYADAALAAQRGGAA